MVTHQESVGRDFETTGTCRCLPGLNLCKPWSIRQRSALSARFMASDAAVIMSFPGNGDHVARRA